MAFIAKNFSFNGVPCEEYGLKIYDIGNNGNDAAKFTSVGDLETDVIPSKGKQFLYGRSYEDPLEFDLIFGVYSETLKESEYLDRYEMAAIANWLTGPTTYSWLVVEQPDLEMIRYHCIITGLEPIHIAWLPIAFKAEVTCDSPYAYTSIKTYTYSCTDETTTFTLRSKSTIDKLYYPKMEIELTGDSTISICNETVGVTMEFTDLPTTSGITITVDNDLGIITSSNASYSNMYQYFNFVFFPLQRGANKITVTGTCNLTFTCEFPVNVGG